LRSRAATRCRSVKPCWVSVGGASSAGVIARALFSGHYGLPIAFACSFLIVYFIRRSRGGDLLHPDAAPSVAAADPRAAGVKARFVTTGVRAADLLYVSGESEEAARGRGAACSQARVTTHEDRSYWRSGCHRRCFALPV